HSSCHRSLQFHYPPRPTLFPYTTLFRSALGTLDADGDGQISGEELKPLALWFDENRDGVSQAGEVRPVVEAGVTALFYQPDRREDRKSTRLNSSHVKISYAVFCLKTKTT